MHVFVDESGNLGFNETSTKFFIVAYIECKSPIKLQVEMKRALKVLHQRKKYPHSDNELKFSRMNADCRKYVLQKISECDLSVNAVIVEKTKVHSNLKTDIPKLYNYLVVHNILLAIRPQLVDNKKVDITFDKSLSKWRIDEFNSYVKNKASFLLNTKGTKLIPDNIFLAHVNSMSEPCLQATDAIAGAYFQKYEHNDDFYVDLIANKVGSFNYLWRQK